ncbi:effector-associated constant component EACC1 [Sphaerisporangium sp. NPDC004334]
MDVQIAVTGEESVDALRRWLDEDSDLLGKVRNQGTPPGPGQLGTLEVLVAAVGQGGIATALASALVAWLRRRVGDVEITVRRPDGGEITLTARNVRRLDSGQLTELTRRLEGAMGEDEGTRRTRDQELPGPSERG